MKEARVHEESGSPDNYVLGDTPWAIQRLLRLSALHEPFTRRALVEAGVTTGMRVLDVGCGPGEVSRLAAELVGETGQVLGIDGSADMVTMAQERLQSAGLSQVSFVAADLREVTLNERFDALVGRLILMHLSDPADVLCRLLRWVRPGGIVVFQEYDLSSVKDAFYPPSSLWEQTWRLSTLPFERAGGNIHAGMQLPSIFRAAGLPAPHMSYDAAIGADPDWPGFELRAADVRMLMPLIAKYSLAPEEEIDIDTLAERLRDETIRTGGAARLPALVSAWAQVPA
jgi:SAM-dependent methyltransferase